MACMFQEDRFTVMGPTGPIRMSDSSNPDLPEPRVLDLGELQDNLKKLREATEGHRRWALEQGFHEAVADEMAQSVHDYLMGDFLG